MLMNKNIDYLSGSNQARTYFETIFFFIKNFLINSKIIFKNLVIAMTKPGVSYQEILLPFRR